MGFGGLISKLNEKNQFKKVCVDQSVIDSIVFYSKKSYPDEFLAMFDGYIKDEVLYISGLLFLPGERSHTSASFNDWMIPPSQKKWGSVHSHPGPSARPSGADLTTFSKHGQFHIIVCEPYSLATMKAYDSYGNLTSFEVGNFVDTEKEEIYNDLEEIKKEIENDDSELSPSIFDLDQDLSFFDSEEVKTNKYSHELEDEFGSLDMDDDELEDEFGSLDMDDDELEDEFGSLDMDDDELEGMESFIRNPNDFSSNGSIPYQRKVSDEDLGAIDLNPKVIRIGGEKINGQSPNLGIIIEFRDGKPILKTYTNESRKNQDLDDFDN